MTEPPAAREPTKQSVLRRFVSVEANEVAALLSSFTMFFALLSAYYIIRPVRDEIGVTLGKETLNHLFTVVFFVMLALVPLFGFIAARFPRRLVLPSIYIFFAANLFVFWLLMQRAQDDHWTAGTFFVWGSVFNLFVVSLFWSLMSELWTEGEAKRVYGFISAGGTAGALAGPLITQGLVRVVAPVHLLLVSAALLVAATVASFAVRRARIAISGHADERQAGGGILDGALKVVRVPMFARIAAFVFLANLVGTFFYLEQARLVAAANLSSAERVAFFSGRDLAVSITTFLIEVFGTAQVLRHFGLRVALLALPVTAAIGVFLLSADPSLWLVAAVMVAERIVAFALANPAVKVIYTGAAPADKYKVQNFIDTVVYRGGDAASGWLYALLSGGAGLAAGSMAAVTAPMLIVWLWVSHRLGGDDRPRTDDPS